ncbi:hypothetical protein LEP1GSC016_0775 [Leptospira borgpetersenii serovar Hardjo-bovis str. Sponselee]|uniref:Uncharacterized protein n=1 Tax=Leptospira borgpetersenii serovar Hardjo-bovis str. Sponselee TaxID=1303729 RepID=M6C7W5_LEPBO|nr:hypothetical protein LEP1GSC016_0775 [Leptospira borgpetersenii serovar Hardjo-bovis str. Sponselee]
MEAHLTRISLDPPSIEIRLFSLRETFPGVKLNRSGNKLLI